MIRYRIRKDSWARSWNLFALMPNGDRFFLNHFHTWGEALDDVRRRINEQPC